MARNLAIPHLLVEEGAADNYDESLVAPLQWCLINRAKLPPESRGPSIYSHRYFLPPPYNELGLDHNRGLSRRHVFVLAVTLARNASISRLKSRQYPQTA